MSVTMTWPQFERCEVCVDGRVIRLSPMRHRLVSVLLMRRVMVPADELIEIMWPDPDLEPDWALGSLQLMVHRTRAVGVPVRNQRRLGYWI